MYACLCARVREGELRAAIRGGANTEDAVGDTCGAGTGCGSCLPRIGDLIREAAERPTRWPAQFAESGQVT
jgi:bacterioferritin-associated ferredoxin